MVTRIVFDLVNESRVCSCHQTGLATLQGLASNGMVGYRKSETLDNSTGMGTKPENGGSAPPDDDHTDIEIKSEQ